VALCTTFRLCGSALDLVYMAEGRIKPSALARVGGEAAYTTSLLACTLLMHSLEGAFIGICIGTGLRAAACWVLMMREHGLHVSVPDLKRQLAYALPFGMAFVIIIPQQQFHSYFVGANVTAAAFAIYSVGCFQLPVIDMLYTPVSEILQLGIAEHDARGDRAGATGLFREAVARLSFVFVPVMGLLIVCAPQLITFLFTDRYLEAVPVFRLALISVPMAALPLDGVMRARAQNRFMFWISTVKLALTVPAVMLGLRTFGPIGALGGWMCAEEFCRLIMLWRTARLFDSNIMGVLPRELWFQALGALAAAPLAYVAIQMVPGPLLMRLFACGIVFGLVYLAVLRLFGVLPPVKTWLPRRAAPALATP